MTIRKYSSISQETSLTSALNSSATTMVVGSASALLGGITPASGETFTVVLDPDTALEEIVDVVYPSTPGSNTLTIVRPIDGSAAISHSAGAKVRHMATGRDFREANNHHEATSGVHGVTGSVVGTTDTQTLTNKTLTTPTITGATVSGTFTGNLLGNVTGNVSGNAGTVTNGVYTTDTGTVTGTMIANNTIVDADINTAAAIAKTKIAGTAITAADTGTVTSTMILDGTILNADINAAAAIAATKVAGTAVTQADTGTVTSTMIADGTIVNGDISATAAISKSKLNLGGTITSADLVDGTIVNADIDPAAAIALSKLATDPLARANHTGTQLAATISNFDTQVRTSRLDQMSAPTTGVALNAQKITGLADPSNPQDAVTLNYITTQKGTNNGLASLDGSGKVPTSQLPGIAIHTTFVVASQAAMLAVTGADEGDLAVRTDLNKTFVLSAVPASTLANWQELLTPTDSVTSVDGNTGAVSLSATYLAKAGGTMSGALAMGNNKITGLGTPTAATDATTKAYVDATAGTVANAIAAAAAAEAAYDAFDDRYLGSKTTAPTLDNDGNALLTGAMYWNSTNSTMYTYSGTAWIAISTTADIQRYRYTATGGETSKAGADDFGLTLAYTVGKEQVYLNGVLLARTSDYNATTGTSITGLGALVTGDILDVITFTPFVVSNSISNTLFTAKGDILIATGAATAGKLPVATDGWYLCANSSTLTGLEWAANPLLPTQTGNSGKYLTTNGTTASWATIDLTSQADVIMTIMGAY